MLVNTSHGLDFFDVEGVTGAVILPSKMFSPTAKNSIKRLKDKTIIVDPQVYLDILSADECTKACRNLASYPWFLFPNLSEILLENSVNESRQIILNLIKNGWVGTFDASRMPAVVKSCISYQEELGLELVCLPSRFIQPNGIDEYIAWLDAGLSVMASGKNRARVCASIPILESNLENVDITSFVNDVVTQIAARNEIVDAYITCVQSLQRHPLDFPLSFGKTVLSLAIELQHVLPGNLYVNFTDNFGIGLYATCDTFCVAGKYQSNRILSLPGLEDTDGGGAMPHFYSSPSFGEWHVGNDMARIAVGKAWAAVRDVTSASESLVSYMDDLDIYSENDFQPPAAWAPSRNNVETSHLHRILSMLNSLKMLGELSGGSRKGRYEELLFNASQNSAEVLAVFASDEPKGRSVNIFELLAMIKGI